MSQQQLPCPEEISKDDLPDADDDGRLWWGDYVDDYVYVELK